MAGRSSPSLLLSTPWIVLDAAFWRQRQRQLPTGRQRHLGPENIHHAGDGRRHATFGGSSARSWRMGVHFDGRTRTIFPYPSIMTVDVYLD
jgi:hypothetical protein